MSSTVWNRFVRTSALLSLVAFGPASVATAKPAPSRPGRPRALNLFATSGLLLEANRQARTRPPRRRPPPGRPYPERLYPERPRPPVPTNPGEGEGT